LSLTSGTGGMYLFADGGDITVQEGLYLQNGAVPTAQKLGLLVSDSMTAGYTLTLPTEDGASGDLLTTDGSGALSWTAPTPAISVPGDDTAILFNDGDDWGATSTADVSYNKTTGLLTINNATIDGGNIDGTAIGATTRAAGSFGDLKGEGFTDGSGFGFGKRFSRGYGL